MYLFSKHSNFCDTTLECFNFFRLSIRFYSQYIYQDQLIRICLLRSDNRTYLHCFSRLDDATKLS